MQNHVPSRFHSILGVVALCTSALAQSQAADPAGRCRAAEEDLAEVSVELAQAYSSGDFDKSKAFIDRAVALVDKGAKSAKACGCSEVGEQTDRARSLMTEAAEQKDFAVLQDKLGDALTKTELTRAMAEDCWRVAAKGIPNKAATPPVKP